MVIFCRDIFLLRCVFSHSIQETENENNTIHNYLNTSVAQHPPTYEENCLEEYSDLISFFLRNENTNTNITSNNQDNINYNPIYHQMNVDRHEEYNINVFESANQENISNSHFNPKNFSSVQQNQEIIYNSQYNLESFNNNDSQNICNNQFNSQYFSNIQHNQETTYNSQYSPENFNNNQFSPQNITIFPSSKGNLQMNGFSSLGENYFTNGNELQHLNHFNENPNTDIISNDNHNNMDSSSNFPQINIDIRNDITVTLSTISSPSTILVSESPNPEDSIDQFVSFEKNLETKDVSKDSEDNSDKTKNENSLSENIIITNFKNPNEVKSSNIYQHILKLISTFVYLERRLSTLIHSLSCGISVLNKDNKISKDQLENRLTSLVDSLILFNEKNKDPNFDFLIYKNQNFIRLRKYHSSKKNPENFKIKNFLKTTGIDSNEYLGAKEYIKICEKFRYIANYKNILSANIVSLCVFFHYIAKINEYYNKNMTSRVHEHLIKILLSITKNDQMNIDCSKYILHNNFIAYWIFELFLQCQLCDYRQKGLLYNYKRIKSKLVQPNINMIVFLFLNTPESIQSLIANSDKLEKFKQKIQDEFSDTQYEISPKQYAKTRRIKALEIEKFTNLKLHENIYKVSNDINDGFLRFYELAYNILEKILMDK